MGSALGAAGMGLGAMGAMGSMGSMNPMGSLNSSLGSLGANTSSGLGALANGTSGNGSMNGTSGNGSMNGTNGSMNGTSGNGSMNGTNGSMNGTNGSMNGTNGSMNGTNGSMNGTNKSKRGITSIQLSESQGKILPGIPIELSLEDYQGPDIPGTYKPIVKEATTGNFLTYFMIQTVNGARFYKLYDISEDTIKNTISNFIKEQQIKDSPYQDYLDSMESMKLQLKDNRAILEADFDRLNKRLDDVIDPNEIQIDQQYLNLLRDEIDRILDEEDRLEKILTSLQ